MFFLNVDSTPTINTIPTTNNILYNMCNNKNCNINNIVNHSVWKVVKGEIDNNYWKDNKGRK